MKKKLIISLALALLVTLAFSVPAFAWDFEDPCVADNEDFRRSPSWDDGVKTLHFGEQAIKAGNIPDGYNLYRDDVTNTGNVDEVTIRTTTPEEIIGLSFVKYVQGTGITVLEGMSPDNWYWAKSPRGYDKNQQWFTVILPDGKLKVKRKGTIRHQDIDFSDGNWRVQIPVQAKIWNDWRCGGAAEKLILNDDGTIWNSIKVLGGGEITITQV